MSIDWSKMRTPADLATEQAMADYEAWKVERQGRVDALVVEVDGMTFDGNEISTRRMADVIAAADDLADATEWTLADNRVVVVTVRQLKQALRLSTASRTAIWNDGRPA